MNAPGQATPRFMTTRWDWVGQAARSAEAEQFEALSRLLEHYAPALTEFLERHHRLPPDLAADTVQGFVLDRLLCRNLFARARSERGRFRAFLLAALQNYLGDQRRHAAAARRQPAGGWMPLAELGPEPPVAESADPARAFDEAFARQVIADALQRTYRHCAAEELTAAWTVLHARVLAPLLEGAEPLAYPRLAAELGLPDTAAAQSQLGTGKRILRRQLEAVLCEYAAETGELAEEWNLLRQIFAS